MSALATTVETVLAEIAERQHGVVTSPQLLAAGLTRHQIQHRVGAVRCCACIVASTASGIGRRASRPATSRPSSRAGRYRTTPAHVARALAHRRANFPDAAKLRLVLHGDVRVTLSALERRFLEVLRGHGIPLPQTNRAAGAHRVDCRWPDRRLTVELDSYRFHSSRHAWEQDRRRERDARARGDEFRRYTWADVFEEPEQTIADLRRVLR